MNTSKGSIPNFSTALKLPYLEKRSKVTGIDFSYGTFGRITPVVHFEPVNFNGCENTKQSIHNFKRFNELKLGVGSEILVSYHSDCLSYITKINSEYNDSIEPIEFIVSIDFSLDLSSFLVSDSFLSKFVKGSLLELLKGSVLFGTVFGG